MNLENMIKLGSLQQSVNQLISTRKKNFCSLPLSQSLPSLNASKAPIPEKPGRVISKWWTKHQLEWSIWCQTKRGTTKDVWNMWLYNHQDQVCKKVLTARLPDPIIFPIPQTVITLILTTHSTSKTQIPSGPEMLKHKTRQKLEKRFWRS